MLDSSPSSRLRERMSEAAFFDVDNTLVRGSSLYHAARCFYRSDFLTLPQILRFISKHVRFGLRGERLKDLRAIEQKALTLAAGTPTRTLTDIIENCYEEVFEPRLWPKTLALTREHLQAGRQVWLVTATPVEVADVLARRLGLTGALGTVAEIDEERLYTGRLVGEVLHGRAKVEAVEKLAKRETLDLDRCWAYSDSHHDVPLLSRMGHPIAINPDSSLRGHAQQQGWPIRDFRTRRHFTSRMSS